MRKKKRHAPLLQEVKQDWNTLKTLRGRQKAEFLWDYYKWPFIGILTSIVIFITMIHMLWEGQKPCRLRVCAVLDSGADCSPWFYQFTKELTADGKPGAVDVNYDQPFDYGNQYYYLHEIEVMTTISSGRMDLAVCNEDMYSYMLALNACMPLDTALPDDLAACLSESDKLVYSTANLTQDENGSVDPADGIDGYYAIDLSETEFYQTYQKTDDDGRKAPLYAVIISNTKHLEDCEALIHALIRP